MATSNMPVAGRFQGSMDASADDFVALRDITLSALSTGGLRRLRQRIRGAHQAPLLLPRQRVVTAALRRRLGA
jgi:hypothetical protein